MNSLRTSLLLLPAIFCCGCILHNPARQKANYYYLNQHKNLSAVRRVAIITLTNESSYPMINTDVTEAMFQALQKRQLFSLSIIEQTNTLWRSMQLDSTATRQRQAETFGVRSTYTPRQLLDMRNTLRCNAILTGTVTQYQPYPHMAIGLRLKLVDLTDGQFLWAIEQIWDTADKNIQHRARNYFRSQIRPGFEPLREDLVVVSPIEFLKFVTYEISETLRNGAQMTNQY